MRHSFLDKYSNLITPVHNLSTDIKIIISLSFIFLLSTLPINLLIWIFPIGLTVQFTIIYISKIPVLYIIKRALLISPLVLPVILLNTFFKNSGGLEISIIFTLRAFLSIITLLLLLSTTKFYSILKTLGKWKFPNILIIILSFMYRYFFLLQDELERMIRSLKLRSCNIKKTLLFRYYTNIIGILFIKSYDRAERVFQAMELRGYEDDFKR